MTLVASPKLKLKTDNHAITEKVELRKLVIREAGLEPCRVLDLFAGEGNVWTEMRRQAVKVSAYTPVDRDSRQPGQIKAKINPRFVAAMAQNNGLARFNVIDVDTYGEPWEIWHELLNRITTTTAVFLTRGKVTYGAGRMPISKQAKKNMGIPDSWNVPGKHELLEWADRSQLWQYCPTAHMRLTDDGEPGWWIRFPRVDYYGVIVDPGETTYTKPLGEPKPFRVSK
jgi:hypothetical protein